MRDTPAPNRFPIAPNQATPTAPSAERCRMELVRGTACLSLEAAGVLRQRLGIAALIAFFPNLFFLTLSLADPAGAPPWLAWRGMLFELLVCVICGGVAALLWSNQPISGCTLRRLELLLFGTIATFFAWLHFRALDNL